MADYSTFRDKPSELELKGLDTIIKSISNRYPFIIGYRFVDDNPNIYVTILSLDLYLPEKYKFFTHMKDNDTGEMIDFRGDVDVDVNNVYFVRPNK